MGGDNGKALSGYACSTSLGPDEYHAGATLWPSLIDTHGERFLFDFRTLFHHLCDGAESSVFAGQNTHKGWSAATFRSDTRKKENVEKVSALVLDYDGGTSIEDAAEQWSGFYGLIHTTKSHTEADHCFRVIVPFSRPVTADEFAIIWARFDELTDKRTDKATKDASRFWYVPCRPLDMAAEFRAVRLTGYHAINVGAVLDESQQKSAASGRTNGQASASRRTPAGGSRSGDRLRKWALKGLENELAKVRSAPEGERNSQLNKSAFAIGQLCYPGALDPNEVADPLATVAAQCGLSGSEIGKTIHSGLTKGMEQPRTPPERAHYRTDVPVPDNDNGNVSTLGFKLTDTGNAERLVARFRDRIRYCPPKRQWLIWDGRRWVWDERGEIEQLAKHTVRLIYAEAAHVDDLEYREAIAKHASTSEQRSRRDAMVDLARSEPGIAVLPRELDAAPELFNVGNGSVDLRTGELRPHRREDLITKMSPVEYDPDATHELWDGTLTTMTGGDAELAAYLQRLAGYALWGEVREKICSFLYGPPDCLKSTFVEVVSAAMGEYAMSADSSTWMVQTYSGGNRGDLARLMGARLVTSVEVKKDAKFDEALIKKVTGDDVLTVAAKYEAEISFAPKFSLWLAANDAPTIRDDDAGMWVRMRRVPFINKPLVIDRSMRAKLRAPEVQRAVLAWMVKGCAAWQEQGLGTCTAVNKSTDAYRVEMDRAAGFLDEWCVFADPNAWTSAGQLRGAYKAWCEESNRSPLDGKALAKRLEAHGATSSKRNGVRGWLGVRVLLRSEPQERDEQDKPQARGGKPRECDGQGRQGHLGSSVSESPLMRGSTEKVLGATGPGDPGDPEDDQLELAVRDPSEFSDDDGYAGGWEA